MTVTLYGMMSGVGSCSKVVYLLLSSTLSSFVVRWNCVWSGYCQREYCVFVTFRENTVYLSLSGALVVTVGWDWVYSCDSYCVVAVTSGRTAVCVSLSGSGAVTVR